MRKAIIAFVLITSALIVCGCTANTAIGPKGQDVLVDRGEFVEGRNSQTTDITAAVNYIDKLNTYLDNAHKIKNYKVTYDENESTYFVTTDNIIIAIKVDEYGNPIFASCSGDANAKNLYSKCIAYLYLGDSHYQTASIERAAEEQTWLAKINNKRINGEIAGMDNSELDATLPGVEDPKVPKINTGALEGAFPDTGDLDSFKLMDLSNYFESPTLPKFWEDNDTVPSGMNLEISEYSRLGSVIKEQYGSATLDRPTMDNLHEQMGEQQLPTYALPESGELEKPDAPTPDDLIGFAQPTEEAGEGNSDTTPETGEENPENTGEDTETEEQDEPTTDKSKNNTNE